MRVSISNMLLVTLTIAIALAWWASTQLETDEHPYVVSFALNGQPTQLVSVTAKLGEPFELTVSNLGSDYASPDHVLLCCLTKNATHLELYVQGHVSRSGLASTNPYIKMDQPFALPGDPLSAAVVTELMDLPLEKQIVGIVDSPVDRTRLVRKLLRDFIEKRQSKNAG